MSKKLPKVAGGLPFRLVWKHNASTGAYIADLNEVTRLIRTGREGRYIYRAEYWGDYSLAYPVGSNALTPGQALIDLRADLKAAGK